MKYFLASLIFICSATVNAGGLIPKIEGTCNEIVNMFDFVEREKNQPAGQIVFNGVEGTVGVFCNYGDEDFKQAMVIFEAESVDMAASLFNALEADLKLTHGPIDIKKTQEFIEALYLAKLMSGAPGFMGTTVYSIWPPEKNELDLQVSKVGGSWTVVIAFGKRN